jgi:hypothetical protein
VNKKAEGRGQRQKAEGRRQKAEGRRQKAEGRNLRSGRRHVARGESAGPGRVFVLYSVAYSSSPLSSPVASQRSGRRRSFIKFTTIQDEARRNRDMIQPRRDSRPDVTSEPRFLPPPVGPGSRCATSTPSALRNPGSSWLPASVCTTPTRELRRDSSHVPKKCGWSPCDALTQSLVLFILAVSAHSILDVVVDDEVQFFVSEAIVLCDLTVYAIDNIL